jgi:hypothetical protein
MKTLLLTLILATLCTGYGYGQTVKSLGYNTTNGQVVYAGTNALTFTNSLGFTTNAAAATLTNLGLGQSQNVTFGQLVVSDTSIRLSVDPEEVAFGAPIVFAFTNATENAAATRTNLGLPLPVLTNTNIGNFIGALGLSGTNAIPVEYATALRDMPLDVTALRIEDNEWIVSTGSVTTDAPTNTTNAVRWIKVTAGTNSYRLPLFQ